MSHRDPYDFDPSDEHETRLCDSCSYPDDGEFNGLQGRWLCLECWDREFAQTYQAERLAVCREVVGFEIRAYLEAKGEL